MSGWLKAGLIGAVIVVVLKVLEVVPCVNCCAIPLEWVAYGCIGALAARWIAPVRTMGAGAGQGALAGLVAAAIGGVIGIGVDVVGASVMAPFQVAMLSQAASSGGPSAVDAGRPGPQDALWGRRGCSGDYRHQCGVLWGWPGHRGGAGCAGWSGLRGCQVGVISG